MKLIIAEKPDVAKSIAVALKIANRKEGYFESSDQTICITWCFGHLFELKEPEDYFPDWKVWDTASLPIFPKKFENKPVPSKVKQIKIIGQLTKQAAEIINACDFDREGERIFWDVINYAKIPIEKCSRIILTDLSVNSILQSLSKATTLEKYRYQFIASKARNCFDWLFGINGTRAISASSQNGLWVTGRILSPTLAIICSETLLHQNFVPKKYYQNLYTIGDNIKVGEKNKYDTPEKATAVAKDINTLLCNYVNVSNKNEHPPIGYSLSKLQKDAFKYFGFDPDKTTSIAQDLYEKYKITTYPRTDCMYLPTAQEATVHEAVNLIKSTAFFSQLQPYAQKVLTDKFLSRPIFNDKKISAHHAIIPNAQSIDFGQLNKDEQNLYLLICRQLIMSVSETSISEVYEVKFKTDNPEIEIELKQTTEVSAGWKDVNMYLCNYVSSDSPKESPLAIPKDYFKENQSYTVTAKEVLEKETTQPPLLNYATLLDRMLNAGKRVENAEFKDILKQTAGIGTEATRHEVIKKLQEYEYISLNGKSLVPTPVGFALYNVIKDNPISSVDLTAEMELELEQLEKGSTNLEKLFDFVRQTLSNIITKDLFEKSKELNFSDLTKHFIENCMCPICNSTVLKGKKSYACSKSKWERGEDGKFNNIGCVFQVPFEFCGGKITDTDLKKICSGGHTKEKTFHRKDSKQFKAKLTYLASEKKVAFIFDKTEPTTIEDCMCPICGSTVLKGKKSYACSKSKWERGEDGKFNNIGCVFQVPFEFCGGKITDTDLKKICSGGHTEEKSFLSSKTNNEFSASLFLDKAVNLLKFKYSEKPKKMSQRPTVKKFKKR